MRVTIISIETLSEEQIDAWHGIQDTDPSYDNAFLSPEFARVLNRHLTGVEVAVFETEEGETIGFLPFERRGRNLVGLGLGLADAQGAVMAAGHSVPWRALLIEARAGLIEFDHLIESQATEDLHPWTVTSPIVELGNGIGAYEAERKVVHKERFKGFERKYRRMVRDFGEPTFAYDQFDEDSFSKLVAWKSEHYRRSGYHNIYSDRWYVDLLRDMANLESDYCTGVFSTLHVGDRLAAVQISIKSRNTLSGWVTTYDVELGAYSPGIELLRRLLRAHAGRFVTYDFGRGDEAYKQQFKTSDLSVSNAWIGRPTFSAYQRRIQVAPRERAERFVLSHPELRLKVREALKKLAEVKNK